MCEFQKVKRKLPKRKINECGMSYKRFAKFHKNNISLSVLVSEELNASNESSYADIYIDERNKELIISPCDEGSYKLTKDKNCIKIAYSRNNDPLHVDSSRKKAEVCDGKVIVYTDENV